jgi:hypothetical protein
MRNEINEANLKSGRIVMTGWTQKAEGVNVWDYFDRDGKYLGPDEFGTAPTFEDAERMTYYAACDANGPISVAIEADSVDAAVAAFEQLDHGALIDGCSTDAEDGLDFCGDGMSQTEFSAAMATHGYEIVRDLAPCHNYHSGQTRHIAGGWMLYGGSDEN